MLRSLGHYVEGACKNDMATFRSSGFELASNRPRNPPQPLPVPAPVRLLQGNTGELLATIPSVRKARHYELRYAPVPAAGATANWTTIAVATTKPAVSVNNLTPGGTYTFQVRAFGKLGYSDWSAPVDRMCI